MIKTIAATIAATVAATIAVTVAHRVFTVLLLIISEMGGA